MSIFTGQALNKSLVNFAAKRGITLEVFESSVLFYEADNDSEWMFSYRIGQDGSLTWGGNIYLPRDLKTELPYWIADAKKFKEVLEFISTDFIKSRAA